MRESGIWSSILNLVELLSTRQRWQGVGLALLLLCNALLETAGIGLVPVYIGILAEPGAVEQHPQVAAVLRAIGVDAAGISPAHVLYGGTAILFMVFTIKLAFVPLLAWARTSYVQGLVQAQATQLFEGYMRAPYRFHLSRHSSELIRNITVECMRLGDTVLNPLIGMMSHLLITLAIVTLLLIVAPGTALGTLLVFAAVAVPVTVILAGRARRLAVSAQQGRQAVIHATQEGLGGVKEVQLLGRARYFVRRFAASLRDVLRLQRFLQVVNSGMPVFMEWLAVVAMLLVILVLFKPGEADSKLLGVLALFAVSMARLKGSIAIVLGSIAQVRTSLVSVDAVYEDLQRLGVARMPAAGTLEADPGNRRLTIGQGIVLRDLWFRYDGRDDYVLKGVNLVIAKGQAVGFVGPSGGGKSTLVDVVLGILEPERGAVLVNGVDIRDEPGPWRRTVGYVPQAVYLIDGSIRQNVALGLEDAAIDDATVLRAIRAAELESLVHDLPEGLETLVGERGVRLSGGQRQRIAIARALYADPDVLVMDEATSALDNLTERAVMEAVDALKGERTILMIAHRLSTVRNCDRIVFLQDGEITAVGTYAELVATHQEFRRLSEVM